MVYDYYKLLGIKEDASPAEIKTAYRNAAKKYHPDVNKNNPKAAEIFTVINEGYHILANKREKITYDYLLAQNKYADLKASEDYSNPYAQKVSPSRKHRYSTEEILRRKKRGHELQREKEAKIVADFKNREITFPLVYRYSINSLLALTGLVMGYQNWFVNYHDGWGFIKLFFSFALVVFGIFSVVNLAYQHLFVLEITGKTKRKHEDAAVKLMALLLIASIAIFSSGTILKKHFELKYNSDYTRVIYVVPNGSLFEYEYEVRGVKYRKRQELGMDYVGDTDYVVVKHSKSNPSIAKLIFLK